MNAYYVMPKSDPSVKGVEFSISASRMEVNGDVITLLDETGVVFVTTIDRVEYVRKG